MHEEEAQDEGEELDEDDLKKRVQSDGRALRIQRRGVGRGNRVRERSSSSRVAQWLSRSGSHVCFAHIIAPRQLFTTDCMRRRLRAHCWGLAGTHLRTSHMCNRLPSIAGTGEERFAPSQGSG